MAEFYRKKKKICQMCAGKSVDYKFKVGNIVYIGIDEYEILEFDDDIVRCYDYQ